MTILVPISDARERALFGGKAAHLAFMTEMRLRVPPGAVIPADEFTRHAEACGRDAGAIAAAPLRPDLAAELKALVAELGGRVSVRSSATLEDARTHSFAGQFLTVLDVGPDGIVDAVRRVWASAFADNVVRYLERAGLAAEALKMAVVIQRQLASRASGVAMGDRRRVIVEAVLGQGEALVSGEALADRWEVAGGRIDAMAIAAKTTRRVLGSGPSGELVHEDVPEAEHTQPALSNAQVLEIAGVCARIAEECGGRAQDCEFAVDGGTLYLLQTRDVTASLPVTAPPLPAFAPPGKGAWELDAAHFQRPLTRLFQEVFPAAMAAGFKATFERYGALLSHLDYVFVNGFPYRRVRLVAAPADATAKAPPPAPVFKLMLKLVPPLRRRVKTAERVWRTREWRAQLAEWQAAKARSIETHTRLQAVDADALDDAALATHFAAAVDNVRAMIVQHHTYNLAAMVPTGDLIAHVRRWSGGKVTDGDVCALLAGASPVSADLRSPEARALGAAAAADAAARRLLRLDDKHANLEDDAAAAALAELRALPGAAGEQARAFLAHRELRLVEGLDPAVPCLRECPSLLWDALRSAALAREAGADAAVDGEALARVRAGVPAAHHAELEAMLEEARAVVGLRDERALYSDVWAWGIVRTVVLAIGRRLIARDQTLLVQPDDLIHASAAEIEALLTGRPGPSATELERRAAYARAYTTRDAPASLGLPELPPPDPALMPAGVARVMAATVTVIELILKTGKAKVSGNALHGFPASSGKWEGPVHLVNSHDDARDIAPGSVLVVGAGSSAFSMVAPLASAVVAEGGGLLSHVAIVCREYRIPCVCGVPGALSTLLPGQPVRVDGTRGVVELLAAA